MKLALDILTALSPVIVALLGWLAVKVTSTINAKVKNEYLRGVLNRLSSEVIDTVHAVEQIATRSDLTGEAKKAMVIDLLKQHYGTHGLKDLARVLGVTVDGLDSYLGTKVEAAVSVMPAKSPKA